MKCEKSTLPVRIRKFRESDLDAIMAIEVEAFSVPWSRENFRNEYENKGVSHFVVAELQDKPGTVAGYVCYSLILDEVHITNFAVGKNYRRRGIAEQLLLHFHETAKKQGAQWATLEVRVSNEPARRLYTKFGFAPSGIRKGYYPDNKEDALIMWADLDSIPRSPTDLG
jgi:ribosomal-protein-alanine N-acetyltransferase